MPQDGSNRQTRLGETSLIDPRAEVTESQLGRYTEIAARSHISETTLGDYSYVMRDCDIWHAEIGKFVNIANAVRINATNHPTWRATQHHFTYRAADYFSDADMDEDFFGWRRQNKVIIGHDVWIGHGATILPGVTVGDGAVIGGRGCGEPGCAPLCHRRWRAGAAHPRAIPGGALPQGCKRLAWWDWSHATLRAALDDFRRLPIEDFLARYETG